VTLTTPLLGVVCHCWLEFYTVYLHAKFDDSSSAVPVTTTTLLLVIVCHHWGKHLLRSTYLPMIFEISMSTYYEDKKIAK